MASLILFILFILVLALFLGVYSQSLSRSIVINKQKAYMENRRLLIEQIRGELMQSSDKKEIIKLIKKLDDLRKQV
jgi:cell division protein FtsL